MGSSAVTKEALLPEEVLDLCELISQKTTDFKPSSSVEVYSDRPFFHYSTYGRVTRASYSALDMCIHTKNSQSISTYVSAVDVYDRYGLDIACSYIKSLQETIAPDSLMVYIVCSIAALDMNLATVYSDRMKKMESRSGQLEEACVCLIGSLRQLDSKQPRLASALEQVTYELPTEVLSLIFQSKRVSKVTAEHFNSVRLTHRRTCLRYGELEARAIYSQVSCFNDQLWIIQTAQVAVPLENEVVIANNRDVLTLSQRCGVSLGMNIEVTNQVISWRDQVRLTLRPEREVFLEATKDVDLYDSHQLCCWILLMLNRDRLASGASSRNSDDMAPQFLTHTQARELYWQLHKEVLEQCKVVC